MSRVRRHARRTVVRVLDQLPKDLEGQLTADDEAIIVLSSSAVDEPAERNKSEPETMKVLQRDPNNPGQHI